MEQYIPKSTIVTEIKKRLKYNGTRAELDKSAFMAGREKEDEDILTLLDTLEIKEVSLDDALSNLDENIKEFITTKEFENESALSGRYWAIAKHAFLLGLRAQKGE